MATRDRVSAVAAADGVYLTLRLVQACELCQDECYTLKAKAAGAISKQYWETGVIYRDHMTLVQGLLHIRLEFGRLADMLQKRANDAYMLETQQRLW